MTAKMSANSEPDPNPNGFQYIFRDGALVKIDLDGNPLPLKSSPLETIMRGYNESFTNENDLAGHGSEDALTNEPERAYVHWNDDFVTGEQEARQAEPETNILNSNAARPDHPTDSTFSSTTSTSDSAAGRDSDISPAPVLNSPPRSSKYMSEEEIRRRKLADRDREAIEYARSLLTEGDTLIFIKDIYPDKKETFNHLNVPHKVYSHKLLATGSEKFKKKLGPTNQHREVRRANLLNKLPPGIKYVVNLTPDEEDLVDLLTSLSCSPGVRRWHKVKGRTSLVDKSLVSGDDDVVLARQIAMMESSSQSMNGFSDRSTDIHHRSPSPPPYVEVSANIGLDIKYPLNKPQEERDLQDALRRSKEDTEMANTEAEKAKNSPPESWSVDLPQNSDDIEPYCPIRHKAAMIRLLQILEGKDPKLDSAPKVWTLFGIANFFECTHVVVDPILGWVLANPQTIECLPEFCLKMASGLKNELLYKAAFSILVSEECYALTVRQEGNSDREEMISPFGRVQEHIDEDSRTKIEYASKVLHERVSTEFANFIDGNWITELHEWKKLDKIIEAGTTQLALKRKLWDEAVLDLKRKLRDFILGRIGKQLCQKISTIKLNALGQHINAKSFARPQNFDPKSLIRIYDFMSLKQKAMLSITWINIQQGSMNILPFKHATESNYVADRGRSKVEASFASDNAISRVTTEDLTLARDNVNQIVINAIELGVLNDGCMPTEAYARYLPTLRPIDNTEDQQRLKENKVTWKTVEDDGNLHLSNSTEWDPSSHRPTDSELSGQGSLDLYNHSYQPTSPDYDSYRFSQGRIEGSTKTSTTDLELQTSESSVPLPFRFSPSANDTAAYSSAVEAASTKVPAHLDPPPFSLPLRIAHPTESNQTYPNALPKPLVPTDTSIHKLTPFFGLQNFFDQAFGHINSVCARMLDTSAVVGTDLAFKDFLLCLGPDEFKYLPLWAGGNDDGSGGVFDDEVPLAEAGPIGPGPSFHTGFSNASAASSEFSFAGRGIGSSVDTSLGVEDGYSVDHVDRRRVIASGSSVHSEAFSEDSGDYAMSDFPDDREGAYEGSHIFKAAPSSVAASEDTIDYHDAMGHDMTARKGKMKAIDCDDDDVDTTVGDAADVGDVKAFNDDEVVDYVVDEEEEDEEWDGGEEEAFEYGDGDGDLRMH